MSLFIYLFFFFCQEENPDLYYSVPWSYGTLGFLVSAEISIIPCKKYVKIDYRPASSNTEMLKIFEEETNKQTDNAFVEGLVYGIDKAVVMTANMTDDAEPGKVGFSYRHSLAVTPFAF